MNQFRNHASTGPATPRFVACCGLWLICGACGLDGSALLTGSLPLPAENTSAPPDGYTLLARFAHLSDAQIVDEESPGRLTVASRLSRSAWRPQEAYSTQLLDGMIRTINKIHAAGTSVDFVIHTGDALDNAQRNELRWFMAAFDGARINPRSGPDDRDTSEIPEPHLDPHHPFDAPGLYRNGEHGPCETIPWYSVFGNHDRFGVGVFPIVTRALGDRVSPLPLSERLGIFAPLVLNPVGGLAWAPITPAQPGPPPQLNIPQAIVPVPDRRYITNDEFIAAHLQSTSEPPGHGFDADQPTRTWYSASPVPGVRLIGLNSSAPLLELPERNYSEGAFSLPERDFLLRELRLAEDGDEVAIIATHHPSGSVDVSLGTALTGRAFRSLLVGFPSVTLHLAGHTHFHQVTDRGGYVEMVTGSIIDAPQQGRIVELWRDGSDVALRYRFFSHLDDVAPPNGEEASAVFDDPLLPMRRIAAELAGAID